MLLYLGFCRRILFKMPSRDDQIVQQIAKCPTDMVVGLHSFTVNEVYLVLNFQFKVSNLLIRVKSVEWIQFGGLYRSRQSCVLLGREQNYGDNSS